MYLNFNIKNQSQCVQTLILRSTDRLQREPTHVKKQVRSCFHSLRQIRVIRRSLTKEAAKMLVCSFICSRIDYCNAVFAGLPRSTINHLDSVLHAAVRVISGRSKHDHITSVLRDELHWLPIPQRVIYKLCLTTYKAINGAALSYIAALCVPSSTNKARLRHVLLTHVSYFSRGPKLSSENGPSRIRDLGHGMICRSPCEHQQTSPGSSRPLKHIFFVVAIRLAEHN